MNGKLNGCLWTIADWVMYLGKWPYSGTILTLCVSFLIAYLNKLDVSVSLSPLFLTLVLAVYWGGLRHGLISLIISFTVAAALFLPDSLDRFLIITINQFGTVLIVSALQHKANILDSLDANIIKLSKIKDDLDYLVQDYAALSRREMLGLIEEARFDVIGLLTKARGWLELSRRMEKVRDIMDS